MPRDLRLSLCLSLCGSCALSVRAALSSCSSYGRSDKKMKGEQKGREGEVCAERKGAVEMKRRERGNGRRRNRGVADITSYGKQAPCLLLMPRLSLRFCSFWFSCVCTMSDLSQGCQIFQDSLLRCVLLWLIHKEAMQIDDVAALRELNLITVSETETVPGNKESGFEHQEKQHKLL